jgi:hypothetical protein
MVCVARLAHTHTLTYLHFIKHLAGTMRFTIVAFALLSTSASAFAPMKTPFLANQLTSSPLHMAGFGEGRGSAQIKKANLNKKKPPASTLKLKPKIQWDRFCSLKRGTGVRVAVRVANDGSDAGEWYEIGSVKSEGDECTELAVDLQKGIIAEHAKRLNPLQFLPKDKVEWAYASATATPEQEDWIVVEKTDASDATPGIEKKIGFEGIPDPSSGFYCNYEGGKITTTYESGALAHETLPRISAHSG